jgi:hypothetical protein
VTRRRRSSLAWSLNRIGELAAFAELCDEDWTTFLVDLATHELLHRWPGHTAQMTALSPDGRVLVRQEVDDTGANGTPAVLVKPVETRGGQALCMSASGVGWLIQATVGSFGAVGLRCENRSGLAA